MALPISSNLSERLIIERVPLGWLFPLVEPIISNRGRVIARAIVNTFNRKIKYSIRISIYLGAILIAPSILIVSPFK